MINSDKINILVIAGTDCSGGAGVLADVKTINSFDGMNAMCAVTAVTAQTEQAVTAVHEIPADVINAQIDAVFASAEIRAIKIGMLYSREIIEAVTAKIKGRKNIVLDPVMISTSGRELLKENAVPALLKLAKQAALVTPNLPEYEKLDLTGCKNILVKGGHGSGDKSVDRLITNFGKANEKTKEFSAERIKNTAFTHGTGCVLSSAAAVFLAKGETLVNAVKFAKLYLYSALSGGNFKEDKELTIN
jgi:hydroxymethylpyrimidine/phosphomethylpyrimidine kinase